jgi:succinylglutamate desuccinylase
VCFGDTLANRKLGMCLPVTAILGLDEVIDGALAGYCTDRGHIGISIESGQHQDPRAVELHVAAMSLLLVAAGSLREGALPEYASLRRQLAMAGQGQPAVVEVRHRHVVGPSDAFEMQPGFSSFSAVTRGQRVARDAHGEVRAPESGLMLMPRYQPQGEDGYFLVREVRPVWLKVSEYLRRAGAGRLLRRVPGIAADPAQPGVLRVRPALARSHLLDVLHLCGYRRRRSSAEWAVFSTRAGEARAP